MKVKSTQAAAYRERKKKGSCLHVKTPESPAEVVEANSHSDTKLRFKEEKYIRKKRRRKGISTPRITGLLLSVASDGLRVSNSFSRINLGTKENLQKYIYLYSFFLHSIKLAPKNAYKTFSSLLSVALISRAVDMKNQKELLGLPRP